MPYSTSDHKAVKVIGIRPLAPVQNSVPLKLMQRKKIEFRDKFTRCRKYNQMTWFPTY